MQGNTKSRFDKQNAFQISVQNLLSQVRCLKTRRLKYSELYTACDLYERETWLVALCGSIDTGGVREYLDLRKEVLAA